MKETEKFSDESDRASFIEQAATDFAVDQARLKANVREFEATGYCLNCAEELSGDNRFCDKDCQIDFMKRNKK